MANTINGIGTSFLGKCKFEDDDSFVTTKWFVFSFFPIVPLGSLRVRELETTGIPFLNRVTGFDVVEELPLDAMQVLRTYAYAIFIFLWIILWTVGAPSKNPAVNTLLIIAGVLLPFGLRLISRKMAISARNTFAPISPDEPTLDQIINKKSGSQSSD